MLTELWLPIYSVSPVVAPAASSACIGVGAVRILLSPNALRIGYDAHISAS